MNHTSSTESFHLGKEGYSLDLTTEAAKILAMLSQDKDMTAIICSILVVALTSWYLASQRSQYPLINPRGAFQFTHGKVKQHFIHNGRQLLEYGLKKHNGRPFRIMTDHGMMTVLNPKYTDELRNIPQLNHARAIAKFVNSHLPGYEPFHTFGYGGDIIQDVIKLKVTPALGQLTHALSEETSFMLKSSWTDNTDWHKIHVHSNLLRAVAQVSSRVFLGDKLCRDPELLRITTTYTHSLTMTVGKLNAWPAVLRRIVQRFLPHTRELQQSVKDAQVLIGGLVKEREAMRAKGDSTEYADVLEWLPQIAKGRSYDPALVQLALSFVAIHTTADMVGQLLFDLIQHPQYVQQLRDEIISVLQEGGWKKNSLYNMKRLDSFMKESLRIRPINQTTIQRIAEVPITLSDGTKISQNTLSIVPLVRHWDPEYYQDPNTFDAFRFYNARQEEGKENKSQFVSTSPEYLSFGHGLHACPGRFFASNEIKIIMCHILLKYEWRLVEGAKSPQTLKHGFSLVADPFSCLEIRRRQEEVNIDIL
ncbi:uncharacterized protein FPRO_07178 [Fusarium proliferatum ET1]|uniref:Related to gibberellin cluster-GA14-synthase n=1 Tax=Fusarium proliferatum (strain ET1) TaxID=1227346 RepID=A0A1L7VA36_FUSPR|nr:uncharacterized protein FPRO_07178 [Fusarium proliferatum ET1]CZR37631.1 related to gibberellin cluster-GA14-synthase [Fusarium proliferatum ET1]